MATHPFAILVDGVNSGANILEDYSTASPTTPWVDPESVSLTQDADGTGGAFSFDVVQVKTPGGGPWWKSGAVYDNARVRFQVSGITTFLGYITQIDAELAENGLGTRATVTAAAASTFMDKIILYKGRFNSGGALGGKQGVQTANLDFGGSTATDQSVLNGVISWAKLAQSVVSATPLTANNLIVNVNTNATFTGTPRIIGKQSFVPGTLRSWIDTVKEAAEAKDGVQRRYWVGPDAVIRYSALGTNTPTYANAPFKIVDTATYSPYGSSSAAATLQSRSLRVGLDHDSIVKKVRFTLDRNDSYLDSQISGPTYTVKDPYVRSYDAASPNGVAMTTRNGPQPQAIIEVTPSPSHGDRPDYQTPAITDIAKRYFGDNTYPNRAVPLRSVTFTVRGADATNNPYGFVKGYKQTGASTYALQDGWEAGQFVSIESASLDLTGLFRIESLTMSFEPGSMIRVYDITCERVPRSPLKKYLEKS